MILSQVIGYSFFEIWWRKWRRLPIFLEAGCPRQLHRNRTDFCQKNMLSNGGDIRSLSTLKYLSQKSADPRYVPAQIDPFVTLAETHLFVKT